MATLAPSLYQARAEINARWPNRDKRSDGWVGDAAHASRESDHNPVNTAGFTGLVRALDIDVNGIDIQAVLKEFIGDKRIQYVIWNGKIYNRDVGNWAPRAYKGIDRHTGHIHVSLRHTTASYKDITPWFGGTKVKKAVVRCPILAEQFSGKRKNPTLDMKRMQLMLNTRGHAKLAIDGAGGPKTKAAYLAYERGLVKQGRLPVANSLITVTAIKILCEPKYLVVA